MMIDAEQINRTTRSVSNRSSANFIRMGIFFSIAFWLSDSLIDVILFTDESYLESLMPDGMELYMRLLVSFLFIIFGFIVSRYVEENNRLSEYLNAIAENEQMRYRALFDFAPVAIIILDADLRIAKWNKEAARIFGWNDRDVIGMQFFELVLPIDRPKKIGLIESMCREYGNIVGQNITENGCNPIWNWHFAPIKDKSGNLNHVMLMGERVPV